MIDHTTLLQDQVDEAAATFDAAHLAKQDAAAAFVDLKKSYEAAKEDAEGRATGSNEKQRAAAARQILESDYGDLVRQYEHAERRKVETAANLDRVEKHLNILRGRLDRETAELYLAVAERRLEAAKLEHETALTYRAMPGNKIPSTALRAQYGKPASNGAVPEEEMPF